MGQQLRIRVKRQRRKSWIERKIKAKADKAKAKPAVVKVENSTAPAKPEAGK